MNVQKLRVVVLLAGISLSLANPSLVLSSDLESPNSPVVCPMGKFLLPAGLTGTNQSYNEKPVVTQRNIPPNERALIKECYARWLATPKEVNIPLPYIRSRGEMARHLELVYCVGDEGYVFDETIKPKKNFTYRFTSASRFGREHPLVKKHCR